MEREEAIKVLSESIHDGSKVPWDKIVEAVHLSIEALSQPSLPSNLDEAAKRILSETYPQLHNGSFLTEREMMELIKAGAEWMAGQGASYNTEVGWILEMLM